MPDGDVIHVVPIEDSADHAWVGCACQPRYEYDIHGVLVVHNAFDQRSTGTAVAQN